MVKVLWYLLFLCVFAAFSVVQYRLFKRLPRTRKPFWYHEAFILVFTAMMYLYILVLARFSILLIAGAYFLSSQVPVLLNAAISAGAVGTSGRDEAEVSWGAVCLVIRHIALSAIQVIASAVLVYSYPILAGIVYFSYSAPSTAATLAIIRITLLVFFVGSTLLSLPSLVGASVSENLSTAVRRRYLGVSLAGLLPSGVLLTTLLWTFNLPANHSAVSFHFTYSPAILIILAAYFVCTLLVPYIIGVVRNAAWQRELLERQTVVLSRSARILRTPKADYRVQELQNLITNLQQERETFVAADKSIRFGLYIEKLRESETEPGAVISSSHQDFARGDDGYAAPSAPGQTHTLPAAPHAAGITEGYDGDVSLLARDPARAGPPTRVVSQPPSADQDTIHDPFYDGALANFDDRYYFLARPRDPRFQYLDWIESMAGQLQMTVDDLRTRGADGLGAAKDWADCYEQDRRDLIEGKTRTNANALKAVVVSTIVTTVITVFFTSFGSWLWSHAALALPK